MIGIRPTMALIPSDSDVQKAPIIHRAALCYIFFNLDRFLKMKAFLKN